MYCRPTKDLISYWACGHFSGYDLLKESRPASDRWRDDESFSHYREEVNDVIIIELKTGMANQRRRWLRYSQRFLFRRGG